MHSTNYTNAFIAVADDCKAKTAQVPPERGKAKTVANLEFEMLSNNPYQYTSDDVRFAVYAQRQGIPKNAQKQAREAFFFKGQPCFRASPLTKTYGWGVHSDDKGRVALYARESDEYKQFVKDKSVKVYKAMRSKRA